jgi:hypothetical protein
METTCTKLIAAGLIDSNMKLRVLLMFCRHPQLRAGVASLGQRLPGNHWALEEALEALAEAGLLERTRAHGHAEYGLPARRELHAQLMQLAARFDDPNHRDDIYGLVRTAQEERHFRDAQTERKRHVGGADTFDSVVV